MKPSPEADKIYPAHVLECAGRIDNMLKVTKRLFARLGWFVSGALAYADRGESVLDRCDQGERARYAGASSLPLSVLLWDASTRRGSGLAVSSVPG